MLKSKAPFYSEIENTQKMLDKKLHYCKNTCKALIALFENLISIEEQYSKSLNQLLRSGTFHVSLNKSKEDDTGAIRGVIDVFLSGMLQVSENHAKLRDTTKNNTLRSIKELLDSLRATKKQCLNEIEVNVKKQYDKLNDKLKAEQNGGKQNIEKKVTSLFKKSAPDQQSSGSMQDLDARKKELEDCEIAGKQKLIEILQQAESVDVVRSKQTKEILIEHVKNLSLMAQADSDLSTRLLQAFEQTTIQLDLEEFHRAKNFIDPNKILNISKPPSSGSQTTTISTSSQAYEPQIQRTTSIEVPQDRLNPTLNRAQTSPTKIELPSPGASPVHIDPGNRTVNNRPQANEISLFQKAPDNQSLRDPNEISMASIQADPLFQSRNGMYLGDQGQVFPDFTYSKGLFMPNGPYHQDMVTKFDVKYLNAIMYVLFSTYLRLENNGKKDTTREDLILMIFKNKMRLNLREVKLLDTVFKMKLKNRLDYQHFNLDSKTLLDIVLENLRKFCQKKKSKIRDVLAKKEDYDYILNTIKHLVALLAENCMWEQDSRKKLEVENLPPEEQTEYASNYGQIIVFFLKPKPLDYKDYDIGHEVGFYLSRKMLVKPGLKLSFPINLQVCEAIFSSILETMDEQKLFVEGWDDSLRVFLPFVEKCFGIEQDLVYLMLLENLFNRSIKPNLVLKKSQIKEYFVEIQPILGFLLQKIRDSELSSPTARYDKNRRLTGDLIEREFRLKVNRHMSFNVSKDIWINCLRLLENLRKLVPPDEIIVQGLIEIAYCSFFYQKENLKTKDFFESILKSLETSGAHTAVQYQISLKKKKKDSQQSAQSHQEGMEYGQLLEDIEAEIRDALGSHLALLAKALEKTIEKSKENFEGRLKEAYSKGLMDDISTQLSRNLAMDQDNAELEEDIIVIANQLGRIDDLLHKAGVSKSNFADICTVALEKWFINYTKKCKNFANQILKEETWKLPQDEKVTHTNCPVDLCYIIFNPVQIFKHMSEGFFKEKTIKKFEITVFEILTQYFEHLDHSMDSLLQNNAPTVFKKISVPLPKKKPVVVNQNEFDELESYNQLQLLKEGIRKICLRLGNLDFIQKQIENSLASVFGENSVLLLNLHDFLLTYLKRLSKKISKLLVMNQFRTYFFKYLYLNFNESALQAKSPAQFRDDYEFSGANLISNLVPIMKNLKALVPPDYLPKLLLELMDPFLQEYIAIAVDPERAPRDYHNAYKEFLMSDLDKFVEFFFPLNTEMMMSQKVQLPQISDKFTLAYKVVGYFRLSSDQLVQEFKSVNPLAESDLVKYKVIPRILVLRPSDVNALQFLKNYKEVLQ